jgi:hypothetical protein
MEFQRFAVCVRSMVAWGRPAKRSSLGKETGPGCLGTTVVLIAATAPAPIACRA